MNQSSPQHDESQGRRPRTVRESCEHGTMGSGWLNQARGPGEGLLEEGTIELSLDR